MAHTMQPPPRGSGAPAPAGAFDAVAVFPDPAPVYDLARLRVYAAKRGRGRVCGVPASQIGSFVDAVCAAGDAGRSGEDLAVLAGRFAARRLVLLALIANPSTPAGVVGDLTVHRDYQVACAACRRLASARYGFDVSAVASEQDGASL